jgi:hypothetical protein
MVDWLDCLFIFLAGGLGSAAMHYLPGRMRPPKRGASPIEERRDPATVPHRGTAEEAYVRFHFADGRVEVRKIPSGQFDMYLEWKGRRFQAGTWTPDGHVYNEVIS